MKSISRAWVSLIVAGGVAAISCGSFAVAQKGGSAGAQKKLRAHAGAARMVMPFRMAGIDGNYNRTTPWIYLADHNDWPGGPWCTVFDCAEISPATPTAPNGEPYENAAYGPNIWSPPNPPGTRLFGGETYKNPYVVNDMEVANFYGGSDLTRVAMGWYWNPETNPLENMIVVVGTAETFADTVAGFPPPAPGPNLAYQTHLGGVVFDFGNNMGQGYAPGFYLANIDVGQPPTPLKFNMPRDGMGAYIVTILNNTSPATLASRAQPMIWMAKQANHGLPGGNPSAQGRFEWDDDTDIATGTNIPDGRHLTDPPGPANRVERFDYGPPITGFPQIQDNLGAMLGFYSNMMALGPESMTVVQGNFLGGTVTNLQKSDNTYVRFFAEESIPRAEIQVRTTAPLATTPRMRLIYETRAGISRISVILSLFNFSTGFFEIVDSYRATTGDVQRIVTISGDPSRFINPSNREIRARLVYTIASERLATDGWGYFTDRLTFEVACP